MLLLKFRTAENQHCDLMVNVAATFSINQTLIIARLQTLVLCGVFRRI